MTVVTDVADMQALARRRVPKMFYDYADTGSWTQSTYRENEAALKRQKLRQRVACNIDNRSVKTTMVGQDVAMPVALAPVGLTGMQHADGEILAAQAAEEFGVPFTLSTMSVCSIEDVAENTKNPFWFQLYVMRDRGFSENLMQRATDAGCSALVLTLDLQVLGQRHKDLKNGLSTPPKPKPHVLLDLAFKPRWCWNMMQTKRRQFGNIHGHVSGVGDMTSLAEWTNSQFDPTLDWSSVEWVKSHWKRKLILKGINDVEDAKIAADVGADAIVVSNHGGRQLDGALASYEVLQDIVDAVGDRIEVHFDSGIRSGQDVFKAVAMGAKSTYIGRAFIYGLGAMGKEGVSKVLQIMHKELDVTMGLCGETDINKVGRHNLVL
ncbi:L-lactate dehydrogenase (cytochrome) [Stappia aggregata IAM 12614]|uniref:L-lactate dehydrogenase (Cytochrome) n=1 Tax=Roseibium aggregatum (strain ATCC 25650 / DSM 13394 / JCM 20685 / NBRC 16684 / NCIMB 2208 / IAM 12614 / B1) TaxID=384765 RepID=A0NUY8_ROSAI|nr:L-lactate dehydrogenase [Roseibium aggregatum]EAV43255.1 L-lactate dehydrogenase (cytochrome) [Stappia aggregata IAM 12614] [Roseibium aggregatum IAM 12614]